MIRWTMLFGVFGVFVSLAGVYTWSEIVPFALPATCDKGEYFQVETLKCTPCFYNQSLIPSDDRLSCVCHPTAKRIEVFGSPIQCTPCKQNEYTASDQSACIPRICVKKSTGKSSCILCGKNQVTLTHNLDGSTLPRVQCITCATGTYPSEDRSKCLPCQLLTEKTSNATCSCDSKKFTKINNVCVPNDFMKGRSEYKIKFEGGTMSSHHFRRNYDIMDYLCQLEDKIACQGLANLCTMSLYDNDVNSPCKGWYQNKQQQNMPWLLYAEGEAYSVLHRNKIAMRYDFATDSMNELDVIVNTFRLNGTVKDIGLSKRSWLSLCGLDTEMFKKRIFHFGHNFKHTCKIGAKQLLNEGEPVFYEPFLKYKDPTDGSKYKLHALPVLIRSKFTEDNSDTDIVNWQLARRFFVVDKVSGVEFEDVQIEANLDEGTVPKFVRFAKSIEVKISVRTKNKYDFGRIYPPLITVHYEELAQELLSKDEDVEMSFSVRYEFESGNFTKAMDISVGICSALAMLYSLLQTWSYSKRFGIIGIDLRAIIYFVVYLCANLANALFFVAFSVSFLSFTIFKFQHSLYVLPPSAKEEELVRAFIVAAFILKIVEVMSINILQINADIFFLDWERPRIVQEKHSSDDSEISVSVWRTYFVANEWNELQTIRKVSIPYQILLCIFFLEVLNFSCWAKIDKDTSSQSDTPAPDTYQFALAVSVFMTIYIIQYFMASLCERFFKNPIQDFVDVCSVANISVFLLTTELYGYYIHGRSVDGDADTCGQGLVARFQREEADLCAARGLPPANNHQTFIVRCTKMFRLFYSKLNRPISSVGVGWPRPVHFPMGARSDTNLSIVSGMQTVTGSKASITASLTGDNTGIPLSMEQSMRAYKTLNKFLSAFFDHALEDLDYCVKERRLIERLLDVELSVDSAESRTVLLYDTDQTRHSFTKTLWYGQEWTLITFDLYLFCFTQMLSGNFIISSLVVATVWKLLSHWRQIAGTRNLSRKTLVDSRFLI